MPSLAKRLYNGTRVTQLRREAFAAYGTICHLCGYGGADTVDHLVPKSVDVTRIFDVTNVRPAHRYCNMKRKAAPLANRYVEVGWLR